MTNPELLVTAVGTIAVPVILYLLATNHDIRRDHAGFRDRVVRVETIVDEKKQTIEQVRAQQAADGVRLASTEVAITQIRESNRKTDESLSEISRKLDIIPAIQTSLSHLAEAYKVFVPRNEIKAEHEALAARVDRLEVQEDNSAAKG